MNELRHRVALLQKVSVLRIQHTGLNVANGVLGELDVARRLVGVPGAQHVEHCRAGFPRRHLAAAVRRFGGFARGRIGDEPLCTCVPIGQRLDDRAWPRRARLFEPGFVRYKSDLLRVHGRLIPFKSARTRLGAQAAQRCECYSGPRSAAACLPAMNPWQMQRASPCMENPPADSPPQYSPGITAPFRSTT